MHPIQKTTQHLCICVHIWMCCMCVICIHGCCVCGGNKESCSIISCLNPLRLCLLITVELGWQPINPSDLPVSAFPFSTDVTGMHTAMSSFPHEYWRSEPSNSGCTASALIHWAISTTLNTIYQSIFSLDTLASAKISDDGRYCFPADVFLAIFTPRRTATIQGMRELSKFRTLMIVKNRSHPGD